MSQPTDGGTAVVVRELARMGLRRGHEVAVACPDSGFLAEWTRGSDARWHSVSLARNPGVHDLKSIGHVRHLAAGADVVHLHSSKAGVVGRLAALTMRRPRPRIVFTAHGWSWYVGGRAAMFYRGIERALTPLVDAIVVVSAKELADGQAVLGDRARLHFVPNGVDLQHYLPHGPMADRPAAPLIVQVGRLARQKGQDRAIGLLVQMTRQDAVLRLVGSGEDKKRLEQYAEELGVRSRVQFIEATDPRPHVRAADVILLPSRWEGMPLALLEAMAMAKAIVATNVGGAEALTGVGSIISGISEADVMRSMAREVEYLLGADVTREELGSRARQRCEERYDLSKTLETYERLWAPER